jgi:O-succinylbenzoate synthase
MTIGTPSLDSLLGQMAVVSIPLETDFRGIRHREAALLSGPSGPGEWAAFTEYDDEEAAWWLLTALEQAFGDEASLPVQSIPVNAIVPALPPEQVAPWLERFPGVTAVKVKIAQAGESLSDDIARVREVRRICGDSVLLRLDVNAAWDVDTATQAIDALAEFSIDYVEQPVASSAEMRELADRLGGRVRLAADELIRTSRSLELVEVGVCDVAIIKPSPLGGYARAVSLASEALGRGLEVVVSSAVETSVGLTHAASVAAWVNATTGKTTPHGLATAALLSSDVTEKPLLPQDGAIHPHPLHVDLEAIDRLRASEGRVEWWRTRLQRCLPRALEIAG